NPFLGYTPTLDPSPQGGGRRLNLQRSKRAQIPPRSPAWPPSPSWGGNEGGGALSPPETLQAPHTLDVIPTKAGTSVSSNLVPLTNPSPPAPPPPRRARQAKLGRRP